MLVDKAFELDFSDTYRTGGLTILGGYRNSSSPCPGSVHVPAARDHIR
jgi:hypothetical protein